jgi:hypothetical protein
MREYVVYFSLIAAMVLMFALSAVPHVFATGNDLPSLELTDSYPQDKGDHMPVQNVGIKLFFNKDSNVTDESVWESNEKCFTLKDEDDKKIPIEAHYGTKEPNYILVTANPKGGRLNPNSDYTLTISDALTSTDGRTLGEDIVIKFTTVDEAGNSKVYMLLMGVMVVGMIAMTVISNKRKAKAEAEGTAKAEKVNPYKLAKEKGISVEKAMALIEKDRQKQIARAGEAREAQLKAAEKEKPATKRVKEARPISSGGSAYKTGRKAAAERKAKEEAAKKAKAEAAKRAKGTSHPKSKRGKGKYKR